MSTCRGGGYRYARTCPPHPKQNSQGLYPLHRVLVENKLGRLLEKQEHVHHIDGDKNNNNIGNLSIVTPSEHGKHHRQSRPLVIMTCLCGVAFALPPHVAVNRQRRKGGRPLACSRSCGNRR